MYDLRNSTALRQLTDLGSEPDPPRWDWAIARLEPTGRLRLPIAARHALGARPGNRADVQGVCHRVALVLTVEGSGRRMTVDGRGRLYVPVWLRRERVPWLVVGTQTATSIVVVARASMLDALGDQLAGETP